MVISGTVTCCTFIEGARTASHSGEAVKKLSIVRKTIWTKCLFIFLGRLCFEGLRMGRGVTRFLANAKARKLLGEGLSVPMKQILV